MSIPLEERAMSEKWTREKRLERDSFTFGIMVGDCPNCGSFNTHDCEAPNYHLDLEGEPMKMGSECGIARELNDPTVGHCDDCNYLWCLECGSELSIDKLLCGHWAICSDCEISEEVRDCEGNVIEDAYTCPHEFAVSKCPRIVEWKRGRDQAGS